MALSRTDTIVVSVASVGGVVIVALLVYLWRLCKRGERERSNSSKPLTKSADAGVADGADSTYNSFEGGGGASGGGPKTPVVVVAPTTVVNSAAKAAARGSDGDSDDEELDDDDDSSVGSANEMVLRVHENDASAGGRRAASDDEKDLGRITDNFRRRSADPLTSVKSPVPSLKLPTVRPSSLSFCDDESKLVYSDGSLEDKYEVTDVVIGSGAFGVVKLGRDRKTQEEVAIKILPKTESLLQNKDFIQEISILSSIKHPNIIHLFDKYQDENNIYVVMELAVGGELFDRILDLKKFSERDARRLAGQLFDAIAYLHSLGVCHRDLKPDNILFFDDEPASPIKITDFGFAVHLQNKKQLLRVSVKRGTVGYAAPEVFSGNPYDEKCDVWSLGVIVHILLSGVPPFCEIEDPETALDVPFWKHANEMKKVPESDVVFDPVLWKGVSDHAKHFVRLALARDPADRPRADEMLEHTWLKNRFRTRFSSRTGSFDENSVPRLKTPRSNKKAGATLR